MVLSVPALMASHDTARSDFEAAYEAHRHDVYRWALRFAGGRTGWAEDLMHDVFLKLLVHLPRLDASVSLGGWLYRVTANLALSRMRRDRSLGHRLSRFFTEEEEPELPDAKLRLREDAAEAVEALQRLPPREAMVLTMKVIDGKSQREIADALEMSEGYVSKLMARGWERLRLEGWEVTNAMA